MACRAACREQRGTDRTSCDPVCGKSSCPALAGFEVLAARRGLNSNQVWALSRYRRGHVRAPRWLPGLAHHRRELWRERLIDVWPLRPSGCFPHSRSMVLREQTLPVLVLDVFRARQSSGAPCVPQPGVLSEIAQCGQQRERSYAPPPLHGGYKHQGCRQTVTLGCDVAVLCPLLNEPLPFGSALEMFRARSSRRRCVLAAHGGKTPTQARLSRRRLACRGQRHCGEARVMERRKTRQGMPACLRYGFRQRRVRTLGFPFLGRQPFGPSPSCLGADIPSSSALQHTSVAFLGFLHALYCRLVRYRSCSGARVASAAGNSVLPG